MFLEVIYNRDEEIYFCFYNETGKHWVMVENLPDNMF